MRLTDDQLAQFDRDGFLLFPDLFSAEEVEILRADVARLATVEADHIFRERTGGVRTIFRVHETDGATRSDPFRALSRTPRLLEPTMQVLGDEDLYIYHSKINTKVAVEGAVWLWHQDYGYWYWDGIPTDNMATFMVSLDHATELGGCLYLVPGTHKLGRQEPYADEETTSYKQWTIAKERVIEILESSPDPVPVAGPPGTGALFHCNVLHGSGHNLSAHDRWQVYYVFNPVANKPHDVENPRGDYVRSTNYEPIRMEDDEGILRHAAVHA
jgi:ectoine hydroxylase